MKVRLEFNKNGEYDFHSINEATCLTICDIKDQGDRHSISSRYLFSFNGYGKNGEGFRFGTAVACIKSFILSKNKQESRFDIITETPNGSEFKMKTLTP